ncbi:hypothetical protein [Chryseobacterium sp. Hurlbut01]|uniref:hypothetical protein n=1 Tax=Chryseobacterium sp. Hurlbut01 TaxID=1681828 RepID=UPI00067B1FE2|nr:hypothetical protein [Chryseobacterium sp. Hurlbut01]KNB61480.1 hypothetical protein AC804_08970 [Chryseobacterium sp. Hurlbut01]
MNNNKKNNLTRKNYVRQLRILVFFGFLFFSNAFSQQVKSDSLIHQKQNTSHFSKSEIIVTNGALIYDPTDKLNASDNQLKESKTVIYVTEGSFVYAPKNSIDVSIVKVVSHKKKESATKVLVKKINLQHHKTAVDNKVKLPLENKDTYRSSSDDSNFNVGNIAKTIGIFYNAVSKSKKAIQFSTEYPILNNFSETLKTNSQYSFSLYTFQNCECYFTRPPPHFS